jgi:hypothetical protein
VAAAGRFAGLSLDEVIDIVPDDEAINRLNLEDAVAMFNRLEELRAGGAPVTWRMSMLLNNRLKELRAAAPAPEQPPPAAEEEARVELADEVMDGDESPAAPPQQPVAPAAPPADPDMAARISGTLKLLRFDTFDDFLNQFLITDDNYYNLAPHIAEHVRRAYIARINELMEDDEIDFGQRQRLAQEAHRVGLDGINEPRAAGGFPPTPVAAARRPALRPVPPPPVAAAAVPAPAQEQSPPAQEE